MTFFTRCLPIIVNILKSGYFKQDASNKREFTVLHSVLTLKDSFGLGIPNSSYA